MTFDRAVGLFWYIMCAGFIGTGLSALVAKAFGWL